MEIPDNASLGGTPSKTPGKSLARHGAIHLAAWLLVFTLYGAADSWYLLTQLGLANALAILLGLVAGVATTTLVHEWFHLLGAWLSGGRFNIPAATSLFVFDWNFETNSLRQFYVMSIAGNVGGLVALWLLFQGLPLDNTGRVAIIAGAVAGVLFGAGIEWPVLARTRRSRDPLAELGRINAAVLGRSFALATAGGIACLLVLP